MNASHTTALPRALASVALLLAAASVLKADLLVYEGFDYAVTSDAGTGTALTNGHGWAKGSHWTRENAGDKQSITAGSPTYAGVVSTGNKFELLGSKGRYSNRAFAAPINASVSDTIWGGVFMRTPSDKDARTSRFKLRGEGRDQFTIFADHATTIVVGGGDATSVDTGISSGTSTRFYLFRIDLSKAEPVVDLWINPTDVSSVAALGTPTATVANIGGVYTGVSLGTSNSNAAAYDEIRIGTTLEDALKPTGPPEGTVVIMK